MLGHFTERATSRGRSRSFSQHGHTTVSRNESDQRRALLLPQEFKELGTERLVVIFENCKPILAEKIRYHREPVFMERLLRHPKVPQMDMDLHVAKVQQRWRCAEDELPEGQTLDVEQLVQDFTGVPMPTEKTPEVDIPTTVDAFMNLLVIGKPEPTGGSIEPLVEEPSEQQFDLAALEQQDAPVASSA